MHLKIYREILMVVPLVFYPENNENKHTQHFDKIKNNILQQQGDFKSLNTVKS